MQIDTIRIDTRGEFADKSANFPPENLSENAFACSYSGLGPVLDRSLRRGTPWPKSRTDLHPTLASQITRHIFAALAVLALVAAVALWWYFNQTSEETLKLGAGIELKYRAGLTEILCDEAKTRHLQLEIQFSNQAVNALEKVAHHELDAAIIPAGLFRRPLRHAENGGKTRRRRQLPRRLCRRRPLLGRRTPKSAR